MRIGIQESLIVKILYPYFLRYREETVVITENKFDKEYSTQWFDEVKFLKNHGVDYVFEKNINGIRTYKYTKNLKLFQTLALFYENVYSV